MPRKAPESFFRKLKPSEVLAQVIGSGEITRQEATRKIWDYIKKNGLQEGRKIKADDKLKKLFGKDEITMFELPKILSQHLKKEG